MGLGHEASIDYSMIHQQAVTVSYALRLTWRADGTLMLLITSWIMYLKTFLLY